MRVLNINQLELFLTMALVCSNFKGLKISSISGVLNMDPTEPMMHFYIPLNSSDLIFDFVILRYWNWISPAKICKVVVLSLHRK